MKRLTWSGAATDPSGYGEATRGYLMGLARQKDIQTKLIGKTFWSGDPPDLRSIWPVLSRMNRNNFDRRLGHVSVQHLTPEQWLLSAGACRYHVGMTTFETTALPATWHMPIRAMDEIWTFSEWSKQVFIDEGIRRPITVIPHGVDVVRFNPGNLALDELRRWTDEASYSPDNNVIPPDHFVFGANFDWSERKNPMTLLTAYFTTFKATDPVVLVLKTYYQYPLEMSRTYIVNYINEVKKMLGLTKTPKIVLMLDMMPQEMLPRFYASLDCYVLPSKGEGWGLTYSEAMASGLPVIATAWSGHTEFMDNTNAYLCNDFKLETITAQEAGPQQQYTGHKWAVVKAEEVGFQMGYVFKHRDEAKLVGARARETMVGRFTWGHAAKKVKARLDEIFADVGED